MSRKDKPKISKGKMKDKKNDTHIDPAEPNIVTPPTKKKS